MNNHLAWKWKWSESRSCSVVSDSLQPHGLHSAWNSPGQNTGVDSLSLLQGIFPTQGWNPGLPHCRWLLYQLSHRGILFASNLILRYDVFRVITLRGREIQFVEYLLCARYYSRCFIWFLWHNVHEKSKR